MSKLIDLSGQQFGRLKVIERAENKGTLTCWLCQCECGNRVVITGKELRRGGSKSCGCLLRDKTSSRFLTHGASKKDSADHRLYSIWFAMHDRCYRKKNRSFPNYGGRGIDVCDEWHIFEAFRDWAWRNGYHESLSIDRIDNDKGYSPGNCRWVTPLEQPHNRRVTRYLTYKNQTKTMKEWGEEYRIPYKALARRIERGWDVERALIEPIHTRERKAPKK